MIDDLDDILETLKPEPLTLAQQGLVDAAAMLAPKGENPFSRFKKDAVGYAREVLGVKLLSAMQEEALRQICEPQDDDWRGKLAIGSSINYGKSFLGGIIINWYYDCFGPCIVATTAPSQQSVVDLLWKEVRLQRGRVNSRWGIGPQDFIGPSAPEMRRAPDWWARGYVAAKGENFKGRHVENMCFLFDESVGLQELYFRMTKTMFKPKTEMLWICFYNPTDTSSIMYQEIIRPDSDWVVVELSALDHPNIIAGLKGEPLPIPAAVSLEQVEAAISDDCEEIDAVDKTALDFEWPPESGQWFKPGPAFEGEFLGRWPSSDDSALWSDALWQAVSKPLLNSEAIIPAEELPRFGCDVARFGDDKTEISIVWGDYAMFHESKGGQNTMRTVGRLIDLANEWAERCTTARSKCGIEKPITGRHIAIKVDDDGVGGGVTDRLREQGYFAIPIGGQTSPANKNRYRDKRSELWFMTRERARLGKLKLGLLPRRILIELRRQAMSPFYTINSAGQREVEMKDRTKARIGRSPDSIDALNLAVYNIDYRTPEVIKVDVPTFQERMKDTQHTREPLSWRGRGRKGLFRR